MTDKVSTEAIAPLPDTELLVAEEPIRIEMDKRVDLLVSLAVVAMGVLIIHLTNGFRIGSFPDPVTSRGLPYFTGTYLILAGLFLAGRRIWTWSMIPGIYTVSEGHEDEPDHPASTMRSFTIMGLCVLWAVLLKPVGFLIVTPITIAAMLWLMEIRSIARIASFAILFTIAMWLAFSELLGVTLPYGPLTTLARSWGLIY